MHIVTRLVENVLLELERGASTVDLMLAVVHGGSCLG